MLVIISCLIVYFVIMAIIVIDKKISEARQKNKDEGK